jgi:TolB-like protein/Tfp pilus assembly protein PilF
VSAVRLNPNLPQELERIMGRALEKDRELRYQHASEMRAELQRLKRDTDSSRSVIAATSDPGSPALAQPGPSGVASGPASGATSGYQASASAPTIVPTSKWRRAAVMVAGAAAVVVLLGIAGAYLYRSRSSQEISSVAVLPFVNASNDPNYEYLSDGITESLINSLSQVPNLAVMSRSAVFRYKARDVDPQVVARDLKVEGLVTGRISQHGDQVVVSAELIDARTNHNLWGAQYDRKMADVLAVQEEITRAISSKLRERVSGEAQKPVAKGGTNDPEAYQLYLKGRFYWAKRTPESLEKSRDYFNQAIEKDPNYAQAYLGLAGYYNVLSDYAPVSAYELSPKARAAAQKALAIDDTLAEAHAVLAGAYQNQWEWDAAEREFQKAIALDPNDGVTRHWYGLFLAFLARNEEALVQLKRAVEIDPLSLAFNTSLATAYSGARQYDLALEQFKKTIDMDPSFAGAHNNLGQVYFDMGKYDLWLEEWKKSATLANDHEDLAIAEDAARVYAKSGFRAALTRIIDLEKDLSQRRYVDSGNVAYLYAALGDKDQTFAWLDKAFTQKAESLQLIKSVKPMEAFHADPRYVDLLKRIGLRP